MFYLLVNTLNLHGLDNANCRSQTYENASNMSGMYSSVQARFREINHVSRIGPISCKHFLNLVGSSAVNYFGIVQPVYTFLLHPHSRGQNLKKS